MSQDVEVEQKQTTKETLSLSGVPETLLWPLWNRSCEQERQDRLIEDPISLELTNRIDYNYQGSFGKPNAGHAIRARAIDDAIRAWLKEHPEGTVIALGEGLESQFWRVDNGKMKWISVDLPESIEARKRFLPAEERMHLEARSALDLAWMDKAPEKEPVFISLAGLLMYFKPEEVMQLLHKMASRFPGSEVFFDIIPKWMSKKTLKGMMITKTYKAPPMPWGLNYNEVGQILASHPSYRVKAQFTYAEPFPSRMRPYNILSMIPYIKNNMAPWMIHLQVRSSSQQRI